MSDLQNLLREGRKIGFRLPFVNRFKATSPDQSLEEHEPDDGDEHEDDGQHADADEDDVAGLVRFGLGSPSALLALRLLGESGEFVHPDPVLRRDDADRRHLPLRVTPHLVLLNALLFSVREVDVERVHQHGDVVTFLKKVPAEEVRKRTLRVLLLQENNQRQAGAIRLIPLKP